MKLTIFFLPAIFLFLLISSSCNSGNGKVKASVHDSAAYINPTKNKIPEEELKRYYNNVKDFYEKKLIRSGFNGAILVAKKGQVIFEDYHGFFDLKKKDTLTKHSAFHLASVSKTFTAMAVLKLAEMGKLSLNDDVKKYFPAFPYDDVKIRLLLSHRSGLPNYIYFMEKLGWNKKEHCSNEDVLNYLIKFKPSGTGRPDTHFSYCNTNYALLGLIIERASGQSYADFLQQQFFTPLHMDDTYVYSIKDSATAMPSYDYRGRLEAFTFLDCGIGDKNIYSTPEDLLKWDQALYTNKLFTKQTLENAFTPYSNEKPGIRNYGYGWRMNVYPNGKKIIYHNGWWHGNNTVFIRMIQDSVTIIVLGNKYNRNIYEAKELEGYFDGDVLLKGEDDDAVSKEEINTNDTPDSILNKKIEFSTKKIPTKKPAARKKK
jgi:CubicO group peptidase (beta-lactamase class C family)